MFATQAEAKRFFVERVLAQAGAEQLQLSPAEQGMLSWSESDPSFTPDPALVEQLATEVSDEAYEGKIAGLLERSYRRDLTTDSADRRQIPRGLCGSDSGRSLSGGNDSPCTRTLLAALVGSLAVKRCRLTCACSRRRGGRAAADPRRYADAEGGQARV